MVINVVSDAACFCCDDNSMAANSMFMRGSAGGRKRGIWGWRDVVTLADELEVDGYRGCEQEELDVGDPGLPSIEEFSFDGVLKAVDPQGLS